MKSIAKLRQAAQERQGGLCFYCNLPMAIGGSSYLSPTAEHLCALSDGGANSAENIVAAHALCNNRRHKRRRAPQPEAFKQLVLSRVARQQWFDAETLRKLQALKQELSTA